LEEIVREEGIVGKTYTKYVLILLATLSVSGCFSGDDKSYGEGGYVAENGLWEVFW
jgi:hypothetical protein